MKTIAKLTLATIKIDPEDIQNAKRIAAAASLFQKPLVLAIDQGDDGSLSIRLEGEAAIGAGATLDIRVGRVERWQSPGPSNPIGLTIEKP